MPTHPSLLALLVCCSCTTNGASDTVAHPPTIEAVEARAAPREPQDAIAIVTDGDSDWVIVVPDAADTVELEAAAELAHYVRRMTGVELPVLSEADAPGSQRVLVGATRAVAEAGIDRAALGEDGFAIRALADDTRGADLAIVGGLPEGGPHQALGTLYAVYHLLEDQLGCRFWAPDVQLIPSTADLHLPRDLSITEVPAVWFRHVNYGPANDAAYRRWHKLDRIQEEIGRLWAPHWVHSVFEHVSPETYFEEHPEYFALIGGERRPTQLCLTHPDVLALTQASIRRMLVEHPDVRYISISQEDNQEACQCDEARAINEHEGSQMGELLSFVNALADAFPERIISTLAYQYSRRPPRHLRPRENVSIMLCTIEEDRSRPIASNPSSSFAADLKGWRALTDDIFLWDYEVQFASPVAPFPNLRVLQPNVQWFVDSGVRHLFLQGNGLHTELAELRCYLLAKLAWDADIDVEATIDEFLAGFYGPAAPALRAYIDLLHESQAASGEPLLIYGNPALGKDSWLRQEIVDAASAHLDSAAALVRDDPVLSARVGTARLPLMYAELEIARRAGTGPRGIWERRVDQPGPDDVGPDSPWRVQSEIPILLESFLAGCRAAGIARLRERDLTLVEYESAWARLLDPQLPNHLALGRTARATPAPSSRYADGDVAHLTDGLPGGDQYHENWVGWEGTDADLILDLGPDAEPTRLEVSALQDPKSWVWLPTRIEVDVSADGTAWRHAATLTHARTEREPLIQHWEVELPLRPDGEPVRHLRLRVDGTETCPAWHIGAGQPSWFFLDELRVK